MPAPAFSFPALRVSPRSRWLFWLIFPWLVPLLSYLVMGPVYVRRGSSFVGATLVVGLVVVGWFWLLDRTVGAIVQRWPDLPHTRQRLLLTTVACYGISAAFLAGLDTFFAYFQPFGSSLTLTELRIAGLPPEIYVGLARLLGRPLSPTLVTVGIYVLDFVGLLLIATVYEAFYLLGKWQESRLSYEHRRRAGLQSQLQSLKNQINPHFLFNTLNSLSSLIAESPRHAEVFVDEMAKVYRYLLQANASELAPLKAELAFIQSYYHLLRTRYGIGLELHIEVADNYLAYQLPPLTLQMLVENAVKHNVILPNRRLRIDIVTTAQGRLCVRNNRQLRATRPTSNHVGLANIAARYQLLAQTGPVVDDANGQFTVTLPLLPPAAWGDANNT